MRSWNCYNTIVLSLLIKRITRDVYQRFMSFDPRGEGYDVLHRSHKHIGKVTMTFEVAVL
jgi:hypothetical protein